ncbi:UNVERIFIED_CONTAM: hypothetical protein HDU68_004686 [Siphonaria sp. JEL0065]|nr:hypothetical protein HDU68_004686 [Siphonaria sp. JEL0065]
MHAELAAKHNEQIGTRNDTAQVHPRLFCETLFQLSNASLIHATVVDLIKDPASATVVGVSVKHAATGEISKLLATHVVIALGPWCEPIARRGWGLAIRRVDSQKGHSIILKPVAEKSAQIPAQCLFTEIGKMTGPEVYPRPDGTVYMCGGGGAGTEPLPETPSLVKPVERVTENLMNLSRTICPQVLEGADVVARQACFLPSSYGGPMIGKVAPFDNLYIGTANSVWGIMNGPATGLAISELIHAGKCTSLDLREFDPME